MNFLLGVEVILGLFKWCSIPSFQVHSPSISTTFSVQEAGQYDLLWLPNTKP